jgi:cardiolipin synthase
MYSKLKKRPLDEMQTPVQVTVPEEHSDLINLIQKMDYNPLLSGNDVKIFTSGKEKFEHLLDDIARAKKHIHVEYYVFSDDKIGKRLQDALIRKAKEGLEIRIIYDSFGSRKSDKKYYEHFRMAGIETEPFLKLTFPRLTSHINTETTARWS